MKVNKFFLIFFILILFSSFVTADKLITTEKSGQIDIAVPVIQTIKQGTIINLPAFVFNSTGYKITTPTCIFNLADSHYNVLIYNQTMSIEPSGMYNIEINTTVTENVGEYAYIITCSNGESGYLNSGFIVTSSGYQSSENYLPIVFCIALFSFLILYSAFNMKNSGLFMLKMILFALGIIFVFILLFIPLIITYNPLNVSSFEPIAYALFSFGALGIMIFVYYYGIHLVNNVINNKK